METFLTYPQTGCVGVATLQHI